MKLRALCEVWGGGIVGTVGGEHGVMGARYIPQHLIKSFLKRDGVENFFEAMSKAASKL